MKIGVQLYTFRSMINDRLDETFAKIKSLGFYGVELAGFYGLTAQKLKNKLNKAGLKVIATHESLKRLTEATTQVIADYKILKTKNIVIPYSEIKDKDSYKAMLPTIKKVVDNLTEAGFIVHYHNHANEFARFADLYIIEHLLNDVPNLRLELDIYWAVFAKVEIISFLKKYQNQIDFIHAKDMLVNEEGPQFTSIGKGIINYKEIYQIKNNGWIIENDNPLNDPLENVSDSIFYINKLTGGKK